MYSQNISRIGIRTYRYGGDEFAVIFNNQSESKVEQILHALKADIKKKAIVHDGHRRGEFLSITCGWAFTTDKVKHMGRLLKEADDNLYKQKEQRNINKRISQPNKSQAI